jgi:hypothetical protein
MRENFEPEEEALPPEHMAFKNLQLRSAPDHGSLRGREELSRQEIERRFSHHRPDAARAAIHAVLRDLVITLAHEISGYVPAGRERAIALTKLEECLFWANAAVAREGK